LQIKFDKRGRVAGYTEIQQNELFAILPTKMNSPKYVYKSIAYSRRGVSLIQAPPEVLCANSFFPWRSTKSSTIAIPTHFQTISATRAARRAPRKYFILFLYP